MGLEVWRNKGAGREDGDAVGFGGDSASGREPTACSVLIVHMSDGGKKENYRV